MSVKSVWQRLILLLRRGGAVAAIMTPMCVATATSLPGVAVKFTGTYMGQSCTIVGAADQSVSLPTISTQSLDSAGRTAGEQAFDIVVQCDPGVREVRAYFESPLVDSQEGTLRLDGSPGEAKQVEVQLANSDFTRIRIGERGTVQPVKVAASGPTSMRFYARYYATGHAGAGTVQTYATYVVDMP
ncbi:fimbrial protein [Paraburkholderia aspalathi]|uniref:fimbrial protein n=1 Tax=Paraburkholderia aspalathi TaxID=1324617 RepID=UPI0038B88B7A